MTLTLGDEDARRLSDVLRDYLVQLKREIARTEVRDLRHSLVERQDLCERLVDQLTSVANR